LGEVGCGDVNYRQSREELALEPETLISHEFTSLSRRGFLVCSNLSRCYVGKIEPKLKKIIISSGSPVP
jgi:hypothetical protein